MYMNKAKITIPAGSQFLGNEFAANFDMQKLSSTMRVLEIDLVMGAELKTWQIIKKLRSGQELVILQSEVDDVPGANNDISVIMFGDACDIILENGDTIEFKTTSATSEMLAQVYVTEY